MNQCNQSSVVIVEILTEMHFVEIIRTNFKIQPGRYQPYAIRRQASSEAYLGDSGPLGVMAMARMPRE